MQHFFQKYFSDNESCVASEIFDNLKIIIILILFTILLLFAAQQEKIQWEFTKKNYKRLEPFF
jgi:hypothetical protein